MNDLTAEFARLRVNDQKLEQAIQQVESMVTVYSENLRRMKDLLAYLKAQEK